MPKKHRYTLHNMSFFISTPTAELFDVEFYFFKNYFKLSDN